MSQADSKESILTKLRKLNELGVALSSEKNNRRLLELILIAAKELTHADGGTLYTVLDGTHLKFEIVKTDSLDFHWGGAGEVDSMCQIIFPPIQLYHDDGEANDQLVAVYALLHDETVNIPDAYHTEDFDFSGTRKFDERAGYRSKSFLTVPLKNHENQKIGVLQLINAQDPATGEIISFSTEDRGLVESLASQAAVSMTNQGLIDDLKAMFDAFVKVFVDAIDAKSPYTGRHCQRVPVITMMLAKSLSYCSEGFYSDFSLTEEELYELYIAAMLHDCGKVVTPIHIVDKATKLETLCDRIVLVDTRFEVLKRDAEIAFLQQKVMALEEGRHDDIPQFAETLQLALGNLENDRISLHAANRGAEFMSDDKIANIERIAKLSWMCKGEIQPFLSINEKDNLCIRKGTLSEDERQIINDHVVMTIKMLEPIPYPHFLKNVPEIAGAHHERMDGKGYPNGLKGSQMSVQARILALADVFEALTASDRPYKKAMKLSKVLSIMQDMADTGHIDPVLYAVFLKQGIHLQYGAEYLTDAQLDV